MKVICFGDSNTYGFDPRSYLGGRYDKDSRWVDILAAKTGWTVCNQGENGQGVPVVPLSLPADTDLLLVMIGSNDLLQGWRPEAVADRLDGFLTSLPLPREKLLLIAPPPHCPRGVGGDPGTDRRHGGLRPLLPGSGPAPGDSVCRCGPVGRHHDLRWGAFHRARPPGFCRRTFGGTFMKRIFVVLLAALLLAGCGSTSDSAGYQQISQEEAKARMDAGQAVVLDVREPNEYESGHIPNAALLPVGSITEDTAAAVIPDQDTEVLVYCRSGNRSKTAAAALAELGYTNVYEFGGINTWPYEVTS